ncbi:unnamed protein product [Polarella glacialis]|uniref:Uncharacterized protein n=1 Tax=Polarella glacialis TaxID=89957 RepID=A0A813IE92_POLGL|nr:unnamed protein product [Polarella glacialis]CAE8648650.1 unnamed protein product [Polarella glacialis]
MACQSSHELLPTPPPTAAHPAEARPRPTATAAASFMAMESNTGWMRKVAENTPVPLISQSIAMHFGYTMREYTWQELVVLVNIQFALFLVALWHSLNSNLEKFLGFFCIGPYIVLSVLDYLVLRHVSTSHGGLPIHVLCGVVILEAGKLLVTFMLMCFNSSLSGMKDVTLADVKLLSVPACLYFLTNALFFKVGSGTSLSNFVITFELQLLFVALLWMMIFNRSLSLTRWIACAGLVSGTFLQQLSAPISVESCWLPALCALVVAISTVSNEYVLKYKRELDINVQNAVMYAVGVVLGLIGIAFLEPGLLGPRFFDGMQFADTKLLLGIRLALGLFCSRVLKHADSVSKTVASSVSGPLAISLAPQYVGEVLTNNTMAAIFLTFSCSCLYWIDPTLLASCRGSRENLNV